MWESIQTSLHEYAAAWGRSAWWLVVGVILVLVDAYLKATDKPGVPRRVWLVLGVIVLFVAPFIVFHNSRLEREKLRREIDELRDTQPKVTIGEDGFNLRVENTGGAATFEAKLLVLESRNWPSLRPGAEFDAFWAKTHTPRQVEIPTFGHGHILLGEFSPKDGQPPIGVLKLLFSEHNYQTPNNVPTEYSLSLGQPRPFARIRATILTTPSVDTRIVREITLTPEGVALTEAGA